jgi:Tfp pilus assembly protein PilX
VIYKQKQQGAVLLIAMVFLIVITIIGVNAVSSTSMKTQTVGNNISSMMAYTGAETALVKTASNSDLKNLKDSAETSTTSSATLSVAGDLLELKSKTDFVGMNQKCPSGGPGMAISSIMKCKVWTIDATARLNATNAKDSHLLGVAIVQ